ncbi:hypothetical protein [Halobaculum gomorrense]|uniref:Uncharacterized protein n=1 Tax=Halobaculum gomorrense TaxID=43928 RepID=A0A1M5PD05_9EURY|nr:hypothetical protein [Halobaculum gomorrense]SHG99666.1 hypothetical protein SAMN05443636_1553 [Halobaculum gomorrense]
MSSALRALFRTLKTAGQRVAKPLQRGDGPNKFDLSSVDTATTTYEGDDGWAKRPPATLECPRCGSDILQHNARDSIDCPRCVAEFEYEEFTDLELLHLTCPICGSRMLHGQRHPEQFDIPEWATCNACRYHWEFKHSYVGDR